MARDQQTIDLERNTPIRTFAVKISQITAGAFGPQDPNGYLLQRYLLSADVHYRDTFRVFGQFMSTPEDGHDRMMAQRTGTE